MADKKDSTDEAAPSGDVVFVGCKLPSGMILEIVKPGPLHFPLPPGKRVVLKGANSLRIRVDDPSSLHLRYAVTPVDRVFWEAWLKQNKELDFVKKGMVFVADSHKAANSIAKERVEDSRTRTGLEAINPNGDTRMPKKDDGKTPAVQTADEMPEKAFRNVEAA